MGSGNAYRDLGFPDADAMLVKAQLVSNNGVCPHSRRDVEMVVKDAPRRRAGGKVTVVFA